MINEEIENNEKRRRDDLSFLESKMKDEINLRKTKLEPEMPLIPGMVFRLRRHSCIYFSSVARSLTFDFSQSDSINRVQILLMS
jgi:hypothetical protein